MKLLILVCVILFSSFSFGADEIYLLGGSTYLDDYNQTLSPELGLQGSSNWGKDFGMPWLTTSSYLGEGFISLVPDASGNVENGWYTEYRLQAQAKFGDWVVVLQDGVIWSAAANRAEFNSWDDKLSVQVGYRLK